MVKEVLVTGKLTTKDVTTFMFYHNYSRLGGALTGIFGVIGLIIAPLMFWLGDLTMAAAFGIVALMYGIVTPLGFYTKASRQMRMNPVFKNTMSFRFTSDELKVRLYTGASEILWQDVYRIQVLKEQVLVYLKESHALIIPVRNFENEGDLQLVKDFVERNKLAVPKTRRLEVEIHDEEI